MSLSVEEEVLTEEAVAWPFCRWTGVSTAGGAVERSREEEERADAEAEARVDRERVSGILAIDVRSRVLAMGEPHVEKQNECRR